MKKHLKIAIATLTMICVSVGAFAQQKISGSVKDALGPVIGASVLVQGTGNGTVTDLDGNYTLSVPAGSTIVVSCIGYADQSAQVTADKSVYNFVIAEDTEYLDDVVVIGYQTVRRRDLTGSVASVTGKELASVPVANIGQAIQGKLAGVNITSQDGRPDATVSIRVRGGSSISQSNEPLVLIDGVSGSMSDVPADQVESIDVLKDASSTAIYGARGANGVILITTKGAKEGKVRVSYSGYAKYNTPTAYLESLDPYDYLAYTWGSAVANGGSYDTPFVSAFGLENGGIEKYRNTAKYDMQKEVYGPSFSHNHDLSVSGGTDKTKVIFNVGYVDDDGMKLNSYFKRANVSAKINQKIGQKLSLSLDLRYVNIDKMGSEGTTNGSGSILSYAYRFRPIATSDILGNVDDLYTGNIENYAKNSMWDSYSPLARISDYEPQTLRQFLLGTAGLSWNILPCLTYHTDFTMYQSWSQGKTWSGAVYNDYMQNGVAQYAGNATLSKTDNNGLRWTNTLNFDKSFAKIHHVNVLVGQEVTNSAGTSMSMTGTKFAANFSKENAFAMMNQAESYSISSGINTPSRLLSFFGRVNYSLLDRYLFTVTMRADASSKFAPSHRWGYFPAAAFAWKVSDEPWMKGVNWLSNLKVRLSYGEVGNDGISSDLWSQTWTAETDSRYLYTIGNEDQAAYKYSSTSLANSDLKWETTVTRDLGIDFGVLKGRLTGTLDLYWNTTRDLLMKTTIPGITGFTSTYANIGQTSNKGVELSLNAVIVENRDFSLTAGGNINFNRNNIDKLADNVTGGYGTYWASSATRPVYDYILQEGSPVGTVRGFICEGYYTVDDFNYDSSTGCYTLKTGIADVSSDVMPNFHGINGNERPSGQIAYPGMAKFRDLNSDGRIDDSDATVIGDMNPVHTGGFHLNLVYKGFDLGAYFNWSCGNQIYNANLLGSLYGYKESGVYENKLSVVKDCWKMYDVVGGQLVRYSTPDELRAANANAKYPLAYNENGICSTLGIEDGSFLRLNNLTIGYTLPQKIVEKVGISNLRIYGSIYNLFTLTSYSGLDPEVSTNTSQGGAIYPTIGLDWGAYPRARSFVAGLNVSF